MASTHEGNGNGLTVGFIGLGNQGEPIAHRIRSGGFRLHVWARRAETLEPFVATGATIEASRQELGRACNVVAVCVNFDDDVREVVIGDGDGVLSGMQPGGIIVVHSTVAPETVIELEASARAQGVTLLDAPVSGARQGAIEGTMSVIVGGDPEALAIVRPVFETFARSITLVGAIGAGQVTKLLNNNLMFANVALEGGERRGIEPHAAVALLVTCG